MKILIESIPHESQRYPTSGDWFWEESYMVMLLKEGKPEYLWVDKTLHIRVSKMESARSEQLVAIHELVEALLCFWSGVKESDVDEWDKGFEGSGEPGDHPQAPYHSQHTFATAIERLLAQAFSLNWAVHEATVESLFDAPIEYASAPSQPQGQCIDTTKDMEGAAVPPSEIDEDIPF